MPNIIETVDRLKREFDDLRPLPPDVIARIEQKLRIESNITARLATSAIR